MRRELESHRETGLTILASRFVNPFQENCTKQPDYLAIRARSAAEVSRFIGVEERTLVSLSPLAGEVRCPLPDGGASTVVARIAIDGNRLLMRHESGALLMFR